MNPSTLPPSHPLTHSHPHLTLRACLVTAETPMLEGEEEEGLRLWHLVKSSEDPEIPKHRKSSMRERERAKAIPEIYLTRLLSMKVTCTSSGRPTAPRDKCYFLNFFLYTHMYMFSRDSKITSISYTVDESDKINRKYSSCEFNSFSLSSNLFLFFNDVEWQFLGRIQLRQF